MKLARQMIEAVVAGSSPQQQVEKVLTEPEYPLSFIANINAFIKDHTNCSPEDVIREYPILAAKRDWVAKMIADIPPARSVI